MSKYLNKPKYILAAILLTVFIAGLAIMLYVFKVTDINISGYEVCTEEQIKDNYMSGPLGDNSLVIWVKNRFGSFNDIPFVRSVDIRVDFPSSVSIQVYEKSLVACFYYMGEYIYFDKDGMILESASEHAQNIPCIEGISFTNFAMNEYIQVTKEDQISTILDISELIDHYDVDVQKVSFNNKNEVTLYCGDIKVFLGKQSLYDQQFASLSDVLRQAKKDKLSGTIDMKSYKEGDKIILRS